MGVPAFFRWLSRKYPSIVVHCKEEKPIILDGVTYHVNTSGENPNDVEFDNLYIDMNGIIHICCHPEDKPAPKNEAEMMVAVFEYIDRIFSIVRPRELLYMAIDGVAPRAKKYRQMSRRFPSSKGSVKKDMSISRVREELKSEGIELSPEKPKEEHFDSNCIKPGTPFMARLAKYLHYYAHDRLNYDPGWKNIRVILSDANVPGEGEHKIIDYIRRQRANPVVYNPNTRHCVYGADADLIMLGLATHEANFTIIREEFKINQPKPCDLLYMEKPAEQDVEFIFIRLNVLRVYLKEELKMHNLLFPFNSERAIDDWVFICFLAGNDFLPPLPSLEIRKGAIDLLVKSYKSTIYRAGGFLTDSGKVNLKRVQLLMENVEDEILKLTSDKPAWVPNGQSDPFFRDNSISEKQNSDLRHGEERKREDFGKDRYYELNFGVSKDNIHFRHEVAAAYVEGLCWVLRYYYQGCASWKWYFPYHYAPFASDFVNIGDLNIEFEEGTQPFKPLEQLICRYDQLPFDVVDTTLCS